jgi:DNA-binding protein HU-beta
MNMNKTELIAAVAEKTGASRKDSEQTVNAVLEVIADELAAGGRVQLVGFGAFETKHREPRVGRNPKTKEAVNIPATTVPVFKAGKALKEKIDK